MLRVVYYCIPFWLSWSNSETRSVSQWILLSPWPDSRMGVSMSRWHRPEPGRSLDSWELPSLSCGWGRLYNRRILVKFLSFVVIFWCVTQARFAQDLVCLSQQDSVKQDITVLPEQPVPTAQIRCCSFLRMSINRSRRSLFREDVENTKTFKSSTWIKFNIKH